MAELQNITERELKFGVFKIGLSIAFVLIWGAFVVSLFVQHGTRLSSAPIYALLFAVAASVLANGFLTVLRIIDWFEKRKGRR